MSLLIFAMLIALLPLIIEVSINTYGQTLESFEKEKSTINNIPQIKVGLSSPTNIAINPDTNKIYVTNPKDNMISIIDVNTMTSKTIKVGTEPQEILYEPYTRKIYVSNSGSDTVSVILVENDTVSKEISVGNRPTYMEMHPDLDKLYVSNEWDNTTSVINTLNDSKINTISLRSSPDLIELAPYTPYIYVSNGHNLSMINASDDTIVGDISLRAYPRALAIDTVVEKVYVSDGNLTEFAINGTNPKSFGIRGSVSYLALDPFRHLLYASDSLSDVVYVIDTINSSKINEIPVGRFPTVMDIDEKSGNVYVYGVSNDTVSVIDGDLHVPDKTAQLSLANLSGRQSLDVGDIAVNQKTGIAYLSSDRLNSIIPVYNTSVVVGVALNVNPVEAGFVTCDGINYPTNQYLYVKPETRCFAKSNDGYKFVSWSQNLGKNSARTLNVSKESSPFAPIYNIFNRNVTDPYSVFTVSDFGNFTSNFAAIPPPIPDEYLIPLYGIIASTIIGWSIPTIVGWINSRIKISKLNHFHNEISDRLYADKKFDEEDIKNLDELFKDLSNDYSRGKLTNEYFNNLRIEISILYEEAFKKKLNSVFGKKLDPLNISATYYDKSQRLAKIMDEVSDAFSKGKLSELHYNLIKEKMSEYDSENYDSQLRKPNP